MSHTAEFELQQHGAQTRAFRAARAVKPWALWILIALQTLVLIVQRPNLGGDDPVRANMVEQLAHGVWPDIHFSVIHPLIVAPLYRFAQVLGDGEWMIDHFGLFLWVIWSCWVSSRLKLHRGLRVALLFQILSFCSMLTVYLVGFNTEFFSALMVSGGLLAALTEQGTFGRGAGWFFVAIGVANVPAQIPGLAVISVILAIRRRTIAPIIALAATGAIAVAEASYSMGHFALSKYDPGSAANSPLLPWGEVKGFNHPLIFGLVGIVFSLGRGLVFYIPAMWLSVRRLGDGVRDWASCLAVFVVALVPLYAKWWAWYGGVTFGPRFFLLGCVPGAFALAEWMARAPSLSRARRAVLIAVAALSAWVAAIGGIFYITPGSAFRCIGESYRYEPLCWYSAEYSSLLAPLWDDVHISRRGMVLGCAIVSMLAAAVAISLSDEFRRMPSSWRGRSPVRAAIAYLQREPV